MWVTFLNELGLFTILYKNIPVVMNIIFVSSFFCLLNIPT
jgi:hypothetical protein